MTNRTLDSLPPTETLEIETTLSLTPRIKLLLTVHSADHSVKALDEWKLKRSLIDFLRASFSITLSDDDVAVRKLKDAKKRKCEDSVAHGALFIRVLLKPFSRSGVGGDGREGVEELERKFVEWRRQVVEKMDGIELNLEGVKFRLSVAVLVTDDFSGVILFRLLVCLLWVSWVPLEMLTCRNVS